MKYEIETKVLDIDADDLKCKLEKSGAKKTQETKLIVDWYRLKGIKEGEDPWYLRIRSNSEGKREVTWKSISNTIGLVRKHQEINYLTTEPEKINDLFLGIGLEKYAHQEKIRISYDLKDWHFDLDQYPGMPAYLEIEGHSEEHIKEAMKLFGLENNRTWTKGERILIHETYGLDWYNMKF